MKIPFDIKFRPQIESGEYKVETRDGKPTRIVCWDLKGNEDFCILALVEKNEKELSYCYPITGCCKATCDPEGKDDLFIITPSPELTEFEKELESFYNHHLQVCSYDNQGTVEDNLHYWANKLLSLARKQLQPEIDAEIEKAYKTADEVQYKKGWEDAIDNHRKALCAEYEKGRRDVMHQFGFDSNGYDPVYVLEQIKSKWPMSWEKMVWRDIETSGKVHCKSYDKGYDDGKEEALKDLPRWKKCGEYTLRTYGEEHFEYRGEGHYLVMKGQEILLSDLEKLPGFKEDE